MKRILPFSLIVVLLLCFAACGDDEGTTTINITQPTATTTAAPLSNPEGSPDVSGEGIVLTTAFGETVPTVSTTAFDLSAELSTSLVIPGENLTVPDVTVPVVVTDFAPTTIPPSVTEQPTLPSTTPSTSEGGTEPSTTDENGQTATQGQSEDASTDPSETETSYSSEERADNKSLYSSGSSNDDRGNIEIIFDYSDWDRIKSQKASAKVTCNGKTKTLKGTVNGVNDEGYFTYTIDISSLEPSNGDLVIITLSKGAVQSLNGQQSSASTTVQHPYE